MEAMMSKFAILRGHANDVLSSLGDMRDEPPEPQQPSQGSGVGGGADPNSGDSNGTSTSSHVNAWALRASVDAAFNAADGAIGRLQRGEVFPPVEAATLLVSAADAMLTQTQHVVHQRHLSDKQLRMIKKLQADVEELRGLQDDQAKLLLRQMATQTANKVVRVTLPELSLWEAIDIRMDTAPDMDGADQQRHQQIMQRYPKLKGAVINLCDIGRPVAHPMPSPAVTEQQLRELIMKQLVVPMRGPALQALECLVELSKQLKEELFVSTEKPKQQKGARHA